ncbi:MAG: arginine--tRNA ligase [Candidatus Omnitrophica bacterium]|nr:arginine--tRNA ligase [Candidatus Omnitrophota bacterium]
MRKKDVPEKIRDIAVEALKEYFAEHLPDIAFPHGIKIQVQPAKDKLHGDISTNAAMQAASFAKRSPREIAGYLLKSIERKIGGSDIADQISKVEEKGGFINIFLSEAYFMGVLAGINSLKSDYGKSRAGNGIKVNLEFVSANPTGPLTIAHGRQAAIGDALGRILRFNGYDVTQEYYLNDCGRQINMLGRSLYVRYLGLLGVSADMPEDGYIGDYVIKEALVIKQAEGDRYLADTPENAVFFRDRAVAFIMEMIYKDLEDFRVRFDVWTSQGKIEKEGRVAEAISELERKGHVFRDGGAVWFRSTAFGDDKDRVLIKSDGSYTYLAPDIAYHKDKYSRGFDKLIDLLGPDHHGYIPRMKAAAEALGRNKDSLDILIVQLVTLMRGGVAVSMSTRKAEFVSLREIIDEIGTDVARFFFLVRRLDSHLDFDIELAKKESDDNPVYYIQYAHARICSIVRYNNEKGEGALASDGSDLSLLVHDSEKSLMRKLSDFPSVVASSAQALEPNRVVTYLGELAREFHSFYTNCRVVSDNTELSRARLFLVECVRIVLSNGLGLLNISLPEKM